MRASMLTHQNAASQYNDSMVHACWKVIILVLLQIWIALALVGVVLLPAAAWALYFSKALCISPYKPRAPAAVHPAAQNGH
jgi:hypothetical protein